MPLASEITTLENVIIQELDKARRKEAVNVEASLAVIRAAKVIHLHDMDGSHRDLWCTLAVNAYVLGRLCPEVETEAMDLARTIGVSD